MKRHFQFLPCSAVDFQRQMESWGRASSDCYCCWPTYASYGRFDARSSDLRYSPQSLGCRSSSHFEYAILSAFSRPSTGTEVVRWG